MTTALLDALDDPQPYTPPPSLTEDARARGRHLRRRRHLGVGAAGVPVALVLALVAGALYVDRRTAEVDRVDIGVGLLATPPAGEPYNILVVGTDSGSELSSPRSDTILVVRVDQAGGTLRVLSLPRDLVFAGATSGAERINEVLPRSGPSGLIATIHDRLGIEISHYVAVDFQGFKKLVDAAGGISVQASNPVRDQLTGLTLDLSCQHLDGAQVLGLVRSRHVEYEFEGAWLEDPSTDYGRMARERVVLSSLMAQLTQMPDDLRTVNQLIDVFADNTTIDSGFSRSALLDLARWGRTLDPDAVSSATLPVLPMKLPDGSQVLTLGSEATTVASAFQHQEPRGRWEPTWSTLPSVLVSGC